MAEATFNLDFSEFEANLRIALTGVQAGAEAAAITACEEIRDLSLEQVPSDTGTLASSFGFQVIDDIESISVELGYGILTNPENPKTGQTVSEYMVAVHEDLEAVHPAGKAKFLEDPFNAYGDRLLQVIAEKVNDELG